jgi:hypothetical protein
MADALLRKQLLAAQETLRSVVAEYTALEEEVKGKDAHLGALRACLTESPVLLGGAQALWDSLTQVCKPSVPPASAQRALATCLSASERLQRQLHAVREGQLAEACTLARAPALMAAAAGHMHESVRSEERGVLTAALGEVREHARKLEVALAQAQSARAGAEREAEAARAQLARAEAQHGEEMERLGARLAAASAPASVILVGGEAMDAARVEALMAEATAAASRARAAEAGAEGARAEAAALRGSAAGSARALAGASAAENGALRERAREADARAGALEAALGACREQLAQVLAAEAARGGGGSASSATSALVAQLRAQLAEQAALREAAVASADAARLQLGESEGRLAALSTSKAELAVRAAKAVRDVQKQAETLAALSLALQSSQAQKQQETS